MWKGKLNKKIVVAAHFRFVHCLLFFRSLGLVDATLIPMEDQWGFFFVDDRQFMKKFLVSERWNFTLYYC
jgi:hypothetical protein